MKHKICILILMLLQPGCSVELRDRDGEPTDAQPVEFQKLNELRIENEYTLPVPLAFGEQVVLRYDRLILGPKSKLVTQGLNVRFEVKELIAEDAEILTFKSDQKAPQGTLGRRGGHLELIAEKATGNLTIVLQGEQGGHGLNGPEPDEKLRGATGAPGRRAIYVLSHGNTLKLHSAENGHPGGPGQQGYPGGPGLKGGDSGTALVQVIQAQDFNLHFQKLPGQGGAGGNGGRGGPGGFGGPAGEDIFPGEKGPLAPQTTVPGSLGPEGVAGLSGPTGIPGDSEKACLKIEGESLQCS